MTITENICLERKDSILQAAYAHVTGTLTTDMQLVAAVVGPELALELMQRLGGITIYIPKPPLYATVYSHYLATCNVKLTARSLGVSQRTVYRAIAAIEKKTAAGNPATAKEFDLNFK